MRKTMPRCLRDVTGVPLLVAARAGAICVRGDALGWVVNELDGLGNPAACLRMYACRAGVVEDMLKDLGLRDWSELRLVRHNGRECYIERRVLTALGLLRGATNREEI